MMSDGVSASPSETKTSSSEIKDRDRNLTNRDRDHPFRPRLRPLKPKTRPTGQTQAGQERICDPIQQVKRYILTCLLLKKMRFLHSIRRFNKLSNDTKIIKIEGIVLKIQVLQSLYFLLFSIYFAHYFVHYLRMNLADKMSLLLGHIFSTQPVRVMI